jgi:hypothetical protein
MRDTHLRGVRQAIAARALLTAYLPAVVACSQPASPSMQPARALPAASQQKNSSRLTPSDLVANGWSCRVTPTGRPLHLQPSKSGIPDFRRAA